MDGFKGHQKETKVCRTRASYREVIPCVLEGKQDEALAGGFRKVPAG